MANPNRYTWDGTATKTRIEYVIKENGVVLTPNTIIRRLVELEELKDTLLALSGRGQPAGDCLDS